MPSPRMYAGQIITADRWNARIPLLVTQENDQTVTSSTTYIDSEITFTPETNAVYRYILLISYSAAGTGGDLKWNWDAPNALFASFTQAIGATATGTFNDPQQVIFRRPGNTTDRIAGGPSSDPTFWSAYDQGTFETDGTLNTVTMQFAQNVSSANSIILRGGNQTRIIYERII